MISVGKLIKQLMKENGLKQEDLGEKLGIGQQQVSKYINDVSSPTMEMFFKMCDVFNISKKEFFLRLEGEELGYDHKIKNTSPATREVIDNLIKVDEISKEKPNKVLSF